MDKADRYNAGKRRWSLVHFKSLEPLVEALEYGANKYAPDNWKRGLDKREIIDSAIRHLTALNDGEELDPESRVRHTGHAMANLMFYTYFDDLEKQKPGVNSQEFKIKFEKDSFLDSNVLGLQQFITKKEGE